jgi:hypothetical protein
MSKVLLSTSGYGGYYASLLSDEEAPGYENDGCCVVEIPESKAAEWKELCYKMDEFQRLWKKLSNEWYDEFGFDPKKG